MAATNFMIFLRCNWSNRPPMGRHECHLHLKRYWMSW